MFTLTKFLGQAEGLVQYSDSEYRLQRVYVRATLHSDPYALRGKYLPILLELQVGDAPPVKHRLASPRDAFAIVNAQCGVGIANNLFRQRDDAYRAVHNPRVRDLQVNPAFLS
jgi:hypothetical protein